MNNFSDQVAAVTGAASGMGRALALALAKRGCHVALADINAEGVAETARLIDARRGVDIPGGLTVTQHNLNVAKSADVEAFARAVIKAHAKVNLVFNNAGVSLTGSAAHLPDEDFAWLMNINFWGVVHGSRAFLPLFEPTEPAHIVNTSSIFGTIAVPSQAAYNASKFAVRGFTYALRMELVDSHPHVCVSCVQPGGVKTNIITASRYLPDDNQSMTKDELAETFANMAQLFPDEAAEEILRGVAAGKAQILVGRDARFIALLERLLPVSYMRLMQWGAARMKKRSAGE